MKAIPLLLWLFSALSASAGRQERFEMAIAPGGRPATVYAYVFDDREETIQVAVRPAKEAGTPMDLGVACKEARASAGINGGYFDYLGEPLGLVIASGQKSGKINLTSSLTSGLVVREGEGLSLRRAKEYDFEANKPAQLIQTGPFLVEDGKAIADLQATRFSRRSVVLTDGGHKWAIAYFPSATLGGLATGLESPGAFKPFKPRTALNLDGGESCGFWNLRSGNYVFYLKEISKVHDFLLVVPKAVDQPLIKPEAISK
jgi:uncharacterized protein YigE (DUF2233 family)